MSLLLLALASAAGAGDRPITAPERAIVESVVRPEIASSGPSVFGYFPIPDDATMICGRVNGEVWKADITRNARGIITAASNPAVNDRFTDALDRFRVIGRCAKAGYKVAG